MRRILVLLTLLLSASAAHAYSILWGGFAAADVRASASAIRTWQNYPWIAEHDAQSVTFPGHNAPFTANAELDELGGWAGAHAEAGLLGVSAHGYGVDSEPGGGGTGEGVSMVRRLFKVVGDQGMVDVGIGLSVFAGSWPGGDREADWSAGVVGVSSIGAHYSASGGASLDVSIAPTWTGSLLCGEVYAFEMRTRAYGQLAGNCDAGVRLLNAPGEAQPIPEPASLWLLGLGLVPLLRLKLSVRHRD